MVDEPTRVEAGKVDAATGEPLAGATMQVVDAEGETAEVQAVTMADEALPGTAPGTTPGGLPQTGDWSWVVPAAC
ncbi:SpaA isopeptide-forming pilin-related protein, partial [Collinsella aerofaciens]